MWANNGDALSIAYTGTGALKSSLTRTGKLTFSGLMDDGCKSVLRTYQNNFKDNEKQDLIDLFLGTMLYLSLSFLCFLFLRLAT